MRPPYPLKDIAFQAGLSLATVDRCVHDRPGVRATTRARVQAAIDELSRQYGEAALSATRLAIDVVMEAPTRFADAVRAAFEAELPGMRPARFAARFHLAETMQPGELRRILAAIRKRGSHGVVLKAPSTDETAAIASETTAAGIPVVTLVTDLPARCRIGYVGMDNKRAGAKAAWLLGRMMARGSGCVLLTLSSRKFVGEEEREAGFRRELEDSFPWLRAVTVSEGHGIDRNTGKLVADALATSPDIDAVYSIGGGNQAILAEFEKARRECAVFAAHDLDADNRRLLATGKLTFVIHHDLRQDARSACQLILRHHRMLPAAFEVAASGIRIATPHDLRAFAYDNGGAVKTPIHR